MRIAVLSNSDSWYLKDLRRAAGARHRIDCASFSQLRSQLGSAAIVVQAGEQLLDGQDAVLVRTMPAASLEQVVFRMDALAQLAAAGVVVINPPRAVETAVDKYLASAKLQAAGLPTPRTLVCQTVEHALEAFEELGADVVVKPLFGSEGRGMTRISDRSLALRAFKMLGQLGAVIYLQQFVPHEGYDLRLLVVGQQVLGMRRCNPHDWRTNVSRGAHTTALSPDPQLQQLARRAAGAVGAPLAGVDVLPGRDGQCYVLEVNAVPGWKALAQTLQIDVAGLVLRFLESEVRRAR